MRAGTPAHPGRTWFTHAAHMLPIALSGENARSPAGASTHSGRASARTRNAAPAQAGFALHSRGLGPHGWRGIADLLLTLHQPAVSACGRGRPRTQDARGSLMLPTCCPLLSAVRTPEAPQGLPRAQGGLQPARATSRPRRRASPCLADVQRSYRLSAIAYRLSPIGYHLSPIGYHLSPIGYHLSPIGYHLSPIAYRLSPIAYLSQTFQRIARITVTRHAVPIRNTICAVRSRVAFRR
jgi:hypothetical protein